MIITEKTSRGRSTSRTLNYVLGPGRGEDSVHMDPRIVGGWRDDLADKDVARLTNLMDLPVMAAGMRDDPHVWHVVMSLQRATDTTPADRPLDDATFAAIARDVVTRCGMDKTRWLLVRHDEPGKQHAHLVGTTAANGKPVYPAWTHYRMLDVAHEWEHRLGLEPSPHAGEGKGGRSPSTGELEKAKQNGWPQTRRADVRERAIQASQTAQSPDDFAARMTRQGTPVVIRRDERGRATGFKVRALDGVWFKGSDLNRDLKKLMHRLEALSRTVDNTRELQAQATRATAERRDAERSTQIRRAYTLPDRETEMSR
jgi:hypothetical protein